MWIRVGGMPFHALGYHSAPTWSHKWPGGCWEASWEAHLPRGSAHPKLRRGTKVEIMAGSLPVWAGILSQPGADMASFTATGLAREAERYLALDGSGNPTADPAVAIPAQIALGLPWRYVAGTAPAAVPNDNKPEYLHQLLDIAATSAGKRWGVDARGVFFCEADPTTPTYHAFPSSGVMGQTDDAYATHLYGRYVSAYSNDPPNPPVPSAWGTVTAADAAAALEHGRSAHLVDLTPRGLLTSTQAQLIVDGMLKLGAARIGFGERLELHTFQLMRAGAPAGLPFVKAGELVRVHGVHRQGTTGFRSHVDMVIAETGYTAGARSITLAPLGLAPRTLADVLAVTPLEDSVA